MYALGQKHDGKYEISRRILITTFGYFDIHKGALVSIRNVRGRRYYPKRERKKKKESIRDKTMTLKYGYTRNSLRFISRCFHAFVGVPTMATRHDILLSISLTEDLENGHLHFKGVKFQIKPAEMEFSYSENCFLCDGNYLIVFSFTSLLLLYLTCQIVLRSVSTSSTVVDSLSQITILTILEISSSLILNEFIRNVRNRLGCNLVTFCACQIIFASLLTLSNLEDLFVFMLN